MTGRPLTRRTTLAGVAAGLTVSGCDLAAPRERRPGRGSRPTGPAPDDPDEVLVAGVRTDLAEALDWVRAAARGRPGLAVELDGFRRLHVAHLAALPGDPAGGSGPGPRVRGAVGAVRSTLLQREARLRGRLAEAAVAADSGALAALLASMSAAVAQRLAAPAAGASR